MTLLQYTTLNSPAIDGESLKWGIQESLEEGLKMERVVAYCGIIYSDCPTFKATRMNDDVERRRVAELWSKQYGKEYKMEDINCDGCLSEGHRVFSYCSICEIRKCARERNVENCAYCEEYACKKLSKLFNEFKPAKEALDKIRASHR